MKRSELSLFVVVFFHFGGWKNGVDIESCEVPPPKSIIEIIFWKLVVIGDLQQLIVDIIQTQTV